MNILLLSSIYPLPNNNKGTLICHYFAKEWQGLGYDVKVVHMQAIYPKFFYCIARFASQKIASFTGALVYERQSGIERYMYDGVPVLRFPLFKYIPHGRYQDKSIKKLIDTIVDDNKKNDFWPDVILGHFINPSLDVVSRLKNVYSDSITAVVSHGENHYIKKIYGNDYRLLLKNIDALGFRSKAIRADMENRIGKFQNSFICYSGIPEKMIVGANNKNFSTPNVTRFVYVGLLIKRKYPINVLEALNKVYEHRDFNLKYIGDGAERKNIENYVEMNNLNENVHFVGRVPREEVSKYLDDTECFVMISRGEAFGLVYLEAMARGCITIASRNEGIDGIILDGYNGFLCEAGNTKELAQIISKINSMTPSQRKEISDNAWNTAKMYTDKLVAERYIKDVLNIKNNI